MSHRVHLWQFPYDALLERYMTSTAHYTRVLERTSERDGDTFEMRDAGDGYRCRAIISRHPSCTCPDNFRPCMHLIHVFLHILGVPAMYDVWYQPELDDRTLESLLRHPIGDRSARASRSSFPVQDFVSPIYPDNDVFSAPLQGPQFTGPRISSVGQNSSRRRPSSSFDGRSASLDLPRSSLDLPRSSLDLPRSSLDLPTCPTSSFDNAGTFLHRPSSSFSHPTSSFPRPDEPLHRPSTSFDFSPWNIDDADVGDALLQGPCPNVSQYRAGIRSLNLNNEAPLEDLRRASADFQSTSALTLDSPQSLFEQWSPTVLTPTGTGPETTPPRCKPDGSPSGGGAGGSPNPLGDSYQLTPELLAAAEVLEREIASLGAKRPFEVATQPFEVAKRPIEVAKRPLEAYARDAERASDALNGSSSQRQSGKRSVEEDVKPRSFEKDAEPLSCGKDAGPLSCEKDAKSAVKRNFEEEGREAERAIDSKERTSDSGSTDRQPAKRARLAESEGRTRAVRWCS